ncbi:deoxyribodipyrimidine photo-lyase [bacterium]|nr:deoxyribodipyrimidine photo-lyase [bacterium]
MTRPTLVWFRTDLRLADHEALAAAVERGGFVVPVFVWAPEEEAPWPPGAAGRWWLHYSLRSLAGELEAKGSRLILRRGPTEAELLKLARETGADAVFFSRRYEPAVARRDEQLTAALHARGITCRNFAGTTLFPPEVVRNRQGGPYRVFTPFWNACLGQIEPSTPLAEPSHLPVPHRWPESTPLEALDLLPRVPWDAGLRQTWQPGRRGAETRLSQLLDRMAQYPRNRDRPDLVGTGRLSPHLHFGELSPRQVWHAVRTLEEKKPRRAAHDPGAQAFLRQLGWREFAHHILHYFPATTERPLRPEFASFPWRRDARALSAWQRGSTGFPFVDAGMRELWHTGWMHNRVRMVVASFLTKHLLLPWWAGARWFWDTLVDADLANNSLGWQWSAGCGADAAPFFRIFNPTLQGRRFDPGGVYIRRWIPELAALPDGLLHQPAKAPPGALAPTYPGPIVDHAAARVRALAAFASMQAVPPCDDY